MAQATSPAAAKKPVGEKPQHHHVAQPAASASRVPQAAAPEKPKHPPVAHNAAAPHTHAHAAAPDTAAKPSRQPAAPGDAPPHAHSHPNAAGDTPKAHGPEAPGADATFWDAFVAALMVIIATEIGDKTFFIAAILSMRHSRLIVWTGAVGALAVMTVLSALVGHAAPMLLPPQLTHYAAILLFAFFGVRMLMDGRGASAGVSEELGEVEEELGKGTGYTKTKGEDAQGADAPVGELEIVQPPRGDGACGAGECADGAMENGARAKDDAPPDEAAGATLAPSDLRVMLQSFSLTFVAEWGDRSQIATIAMAASSDMWGVNVGAVIGHALCTGLAVRDPSSPPHQRRRHADPSPSAQVVGGKLLASRISERTVLLAGGALFLLFALVELIRGPDAM